MFLNNLLSVFKGDYNVGIGIVCFVVAIMGFATTIVLKLSIHAVFSKKELQYSSLSIKAFVF